MSHAFGMAFVYMINKNGPKIEPLGTPVVMFAREDLVSLNSTNGLRSY